MLYSDGLSPLSVPVCLVLYMRPYYNHLYSRGTVSIIVFFFSLLSSTSSPHQYGLIFRYQFHVPSFHPLFTQFYSSSIVLFPVLIFPPHRLLYRCMVLSFYNVSNLLLSLFILFKFTSSISTHPLIISLYGICISSLTKQ